MSTLSVALICGAIAFVAGMLASKAWFSSLATTASAPDVDAAESTAPETSAEPEMPPTEEAIADPFADVLVKAAPLPVKEKKPESPSKNEAKRYRRRIDALNKVIKRHEESRNEIRKKLNRFQKKHEERGKSLADLRQQIKKLTGENAKVTARLEERNQRISELEHSTTASLSSNTTEVGILRIERDELAARVLRAESELTATSIDAKDIDEESDLTRLRADVGEMRETLAARDRAVHELELQLRDRDKQNQQLQEKLENWKQRVAPLTKKLRQQKEVLQRYYLQGSADDADPAPEPDTHKDDLQAIHGIGPALERRLYQNGIVRYQQIAELTDDQLHELAERLAITPSLVQRDRWSEQAHELATGAPEPA